MARDRRPEPTEQTPQGLEVRVPERAELLGSHAAVSRTMLARFEGGPASGRTEEVDEPPGETFLWTDAADLEPVPEGGEYSEPGDAEHTYRLSRYERDPLATEPRATYAYAGPAARP